MIIMIIRIMIAGDRRLPETPAVLSGKHLSDTTCLYIYMRMCMCVYIYIYIYIYICFIHTYMHTHIHTCMHACMHVFFESGECFLRKLS